MLHLAMRSITLQLQCNNVNISNIKRKNNCPFTELKGDRMMNEKYEFSVDGAVLPLTEKEREIAKLIVSLSEEQLEELEEVLEGIKKGVVEKNFECE